MAVAIMQVGCATIEVARLQSYVHSRKKKLPGGSMYTYYFQKLFDNHLNVL